MLSCSCDSSDSKPPPPPPPQCTDGCRRGHATYNNHPEPGWKSTGRATSTPDTPSTHRWAAFSPFKHLLRSMAKRSQALKYLRIGCSSWQLIRASICCRAEGGREELWVWPQRAGRAEAGGCPSGARPSKQRCGPAAPPGREEGSKYARRTSLQQGCLLTCRGGCMDNSCRGLA